MDRTQMDVIDLLISVLKEHEKTMDALIGRLENAIAVGVNKGLLEDWK